MQVFHLGYPKSGSTTIQALLRADKTIAFLGKPYRTPQAEYYVREHLASGDLRQLAPDTIADMRRHLCEGQPIISEELLSGVGFAHAMAANSLLQIVDNIDRLTNGDFVAYVIFRQPESFLRSHFGQLTRLSGGMSFDQYCSLVLLRRHRWVFRGLRYREILRSDACRAGKLRPVLFEQLFAGGQLGEFMRSAFGMSILPDVPHAITSNVSDTDTVIDQLAHRSRFNPSALTESPVAFPSSQEHIWMDQMQEPLRSTFLELWQSEKADSDRANAHSLNLLNDMRANFARHRGRRPVSPILRELLDAVGAENEGIAEEHPELPFAQYKYFSPGTDQPQAA